MDQIVLLKFCRFLGYILTLLEGFHVPARQGKFYMIEAGTCSVHTGLVVFIQHLYQDFGKYEFVFFCVKSL